MLLECYALFVRSDGCTAMCQRPQLLTVSETWPFVLSERPVWVILTGSRLLVVPESAREMNAQSVPSRWIASCQLNDDPPFTPAA